MSVARLAALVLRYNELEADRNRLRTELAEIETNHTGLINEILDHSPVCWDGDAAAASLAVDYVRHLEALLIRLPGDGQYGHRAGCNCP